jgi:acyl-CoA reductase-like NAD-dependent aldehyde dehydrogenase
MSYLHDGRIVLGGESDAPERFIAPTILLDPPLDAPVMQDEIFGPILPVLAVRDLDEALRLIQSRPKPLALYLFSESPRAQARVLAETSSGGVGINDTIQQIVTPHLPFGGVGESGMGSYHGASSFACFSHAKSVLKRATWCDPELQYPRVPLSLPALKRILGFMLGR